MHIFDEPKIDCHAHVIDPVNFPYGKNVVYRPSAQEIGTAAQFREVMKSYGVKHALLVQPNSGYEDDNACMLDAIAKGEGRFKGIAIVDLGIDIAALKTLQAQGIVGAAINPTVHGNDYYKHADGLMKRLADLDMFFNLQVEHDQFLMYAPWIEQIPVKVLIDHAGRPDPAAGPEPAGLRGDAASGENRARERQDFRLSEIRQNALSLRGLPAIRAGAGRRIHARSLPVGIGLALSARDRAPGLRPARSTGRTALSGCR